MDNAKQVRAPGLRLVRVMEALYAAEINSAVSAFWDAGFTVRLGDDMNGWVAEVYAEGNALDEAAAPLLLAAFEKFPSAQIFGFGGDRYDEQIGWSGEHPSSIDKYQCEFCKAEHEDYLLLAHADACLVTAIRAALTKAGV